MKSFRDYLALVYEAIKVDYFYLTLKCKFNIQPSWNVFKIIFDINLQSIKKLLNTPAFYLFQSLCTAKRVISRTMRISAGL
jgi:hypothetical protein